MKLEILLVFLFFSFTANSQNDFVISGYVQDSISGERLIGASIYDSEHNIGTSTNKYGFFTLVVSPDEPTEINFSYVGYLMKIVPVREFQNGEKVINLVENNLLEEVSIIASPSLPVDNIKLDIKKITTLSYVGETDLLRSIQLLPGIQSGSEGQVAFYVRGGTSDQNLVLIDDTPIYNPSHAIGFLSSFNTDAVKSVSLYKDGFPAEYGGRVSSVLDISMKDGDLNKFHASGSVGLLSSKLLLEGPLVKNKTSFVFSGRRTYLDYIVKPFLPLIQNKTEATVSPSIFFYDVNFKIKHYFNSKNTFYLNTFYTKDKFNILTGTDKNNFAGGLQWSNALGSIRWNSQIRRNLFLNTTVHYSSFDNNLSSSYIRTIDDNEEEFSSRFVTQIVDRSVKTAFEYTPLNSHLIKFGSELIKHSYSTGEIEALIRINDLQQDTTFGNLPISADEINIYLQDDMTFGNFGLSVGLRATWFKLDINSYNILQPRFKTTYTTEKFGAQVTYSRMTQFVNLLSSSSLSLPTDLWVPTTNRFSPQISDQVSLATSFKKITSHNLNVTLSTFYRTFEGLLNYKQGENFLTANDLELDIDFNWENKVEQGKGDSYGLEIGIDKNGDKLSAYLAYTLLWSNRNFPNINAGKTFPYRYARRHDISLGFIYKIKENIIFSSNWVFGSGNAISLPYFRYPVYFETIELNGETPFEQFNFVTSVGDKNSIRMSNFHRLDFNITFRKKKKKYEREIVFGAYNTYFHSNPYSINSFTDNSGKTVFEEISLLPFLIPSISYNFKF